MSAGASLRRCGRVGALLLAALLALAAAPASAKPAVWVVRSPQATITLFGSVHLLPAGLDWRPPALDAALASADEIWFELPINAATNNIAAAEAVRRGFLPKGHELGEQLDPQELARLRQAAAATGCALPALLRMQPWMADLTLSVAEDVTSGANATDGVEEQVEALTPPTAVRHAFETAVQQVEFLAGTPVKDQLASLDWTLKEIEEDPASYPRVVSEWMAGDVAGIQRDAVDPVQRVSAKLYDRLIGQRNRRWTALLAQRLTRPGRIVVVVGAGHLVGAAGVPALLRARGFQVDGP